MDNFAVIDLGSNSVRLVLYHHDDSGTVQEIDNIKSVLRLSAHINDQKEITEEGLRITLECLKRYKTICEGKGIDHVLGVATAAVRQAGNRAQVIEAIYQETGIPFRILTGQEEAYFGYLAIVNTLDYQDAVTVDIGGGSTEVTYFKGRSLQQAHSFPFGAVTLTQSFLRSDPPAPAQIESLKQFLAEQIGTQSWIQGLNCPLIVMGGTARNLARMHQRKVGYSLSSLHNYRLSRAQLVELMDQLAFMPLDCRKHVDGLSKDRADIIFAGLMAFDEIMKRVGSRELISSNKGLRDGLVFDLILDDQEKRLPDVLEYSTAQFMKRYRVNLSHANHVAFLTGQMFDQLREMGVLTLGDRERILLQTASRLFDIGRSINIIESAKHTFYLIENVLLLGVTHQERLMIGLMASYKSAKQMKKTAEPYGDLLGKEQLQTIQWLGTLVQCGRVMDRMMDQKVREVSFSFGKSKLQLRVSGVSEEDWVYLIIKDQMGKLSKLLGITIQLKTT